jgi:spore maturation protein SpmA
MLNGIFVFVVLASIMLAAWTGRMAELQAAILGESGHAVEIAIKLIGVMAFFLGLMKVAEDGGLLRLICRVVAPVMRRLFPSVPPDHPAMSAMIMNIGSNMLGLGNAATPFGIRAIEELDKLNGRKGTATNAMVLFLAINTAGLAILPSGVAALRASLGSADTFGIWIPTLFASGCATVVGVTAALLLSRLRAYRRTAPPLAPSSSLSAEESAAEGSDETPEPPRRQPLWRAVLAALFCAAFAALIVRHAVFLSPADSPGALIREIGSSWALPTLVGALVLFGWARGVRVYDALVEGAKEGFQVAVRIIPYLVAILVGVGMLRAAGGIDILVRLLGPVTDRIGMPAEVLPMALLRPLTGSGAYGVMAEIMSTHGPDSFIGYMVSTLQGSTETTFYVLAVYFGAVKIKITRHAIPACLMADVAGILAAVLIVNLLFG